MAIAKTCCTRYFQNWYMMLRMGSEAEGMSSRACSEAEMCICSDDDAIELQRGWIAYSKNLVKYGLRERCNFATRILSRILYNAFYVAIAVRPYASALVLMAENRSSARRFATPRNNRPLS